jgi:hypothetical protein
LQECEGDHRGQGVVMQTVPVAALEVIEDRLLLET